MVFEGIYKDRGSKFLAFAEPITSEEEAKSRIAWYKKKYHDARHVCYAYRLGPNLWRTKDDGEPHGTAGAPILRSIDARSLDNILVVVVRYFGGTLLGTGGLVKAYSQSAKDAIEKLPTKPLVKETSFTFQIGYDIYDSIKYLLKKYDVRITDENFAEAIKIKAAVKESQFADVENEIMQLTAGKVKLER
jgi:uncharacterized YigZ family protein